MSVFTNVSPRLIHAPLGTMMIPGMPCDLDDEESSNQGFQDLVTAGDIVAGPPPAGADVEKTRAEKAVEALDKLQEERAEGLPGGVPLPAMPGVTVTKETVTATRQPPPAPAPHPQAHSQQQAHPAPAAGATKAQ